MPIWIVIITIWIVITTTFHQNYNVFANNWLSLRRRRRRSFQLRSLLNTLTHTCTRMHAHVYSHACTHVLARMHTCTHIHVCTLYPYTHSCTHIQVYVCTLLTRCSASANHALMHSHSRVCMYSINTLQCLCKSLVATPPASPPFVLIDTMIR
jgi:hypothetical protein